MISKIDHIGIAVKDLQQAIEFYEQVLGLTVKGIEEVPEQKVRVAFLPLGESKVELLESMTPDGPVARFIEKNGEGVQHIAFRVENLAEKLEELKARGVRLIDEIPRKGAGGALIAFIHPKASLGTLVELCERK
ncbi:MAG: methylmalonyl-CoA epimerase [Desulfurispora sp.]|uniref:methylmalonyl-CoA epimerase n=1 Tax=Desulfurispora sp. TaxID=3014275 RepID=UPI00404954E5